ncbi:replication initiator, partial [Streptomyces albidoflavus]
LAGILLTPLADGAGRHAADGPTLPSTKSRAYSTTLGALRQVRADYRAAEQRAALGLPDPDDHPEATTLTLAHWAYAGNGHTPGESWLAANIHRDIQHNRETAREHRDELLSDEEEW